MTKRVYRATVADVKGIHAALMAGTSEGQLLPRSLSDLYSHIRDFSVMREKSGRIIGCCALSVVWDNLAEIRSLYVETALRRMGFGRLLAESCLKDALKLGVSRIFTLTYRQDFFSGIGFQEVGKETLPQKIWADCIHCPKFPDCDEIAMQRTL